MADGLIKDAKRYIKGVPDSENYGDPMTGLEAGQLYDYVRQKHQAQRAGLHYDLRLHGPDNMAYSWATKKELPEPGGRIALYQTPLHSQAYSQFQGKIGKGYGAGYVKKDDEGQFLITKVGPTAIHFSRADTRFPERFVLVKPKSEESKSWLLVNVTPVKPTPYNKVHYKKIPAEQVDKFIDQMNNGDSMEAKIDGASSLIQVMKDGAEVVSYRAAKETGRPIVHSERMFQGVKPQVNVPPKLRGSILKGEIYGVRQDERGTAGDAGERPVQAGGPAAAGLGQQSDVGASQKVPRGPFGTDRVLGPQELGGILNATLANAIRKQREQGIGLRDAVYDIQQYGKKPVGLDTPRSERRRMLEEVVKYLPPQIHATEAATTPEAARELWGQISGGTHPLTREGVVLHHATGVPSKAKLFDEQDVVIRNIFPGEGKYRGVGAGGFEYSLPDSNEILGRVGTGFNDETRRDMLANADAYLGRTARIRSQGQFDSGAYRAPSFIASHEDIPAVKAADLIPGGRADNVPDSAFPKKELAKGVKHEREHTSNKAIATEIAEDHISEIPNYYEKLEKLEKEGKELPYRDRVEVFGLNPAGKVLGGYYDSDKTHGVFGGGVDPGQTPEQAAAREYLEEAGYKLNNPRILPIAPVTVDWKPPYVTPAHAERAKQFKGSRTLFATGDIDDNERQRATDPSGLQNIRFRALQTALRKTQPQQAWSPETARQRRAVLLYLMKARRQVMAGQQEQNTKMAGLIKQAIPGLGGMTPSTAFHANRSGSQLPDNLKPQMQPQYANETPGGQFRQEFPNANPRALRDMQGMAPENELAGQQRASASFRGRTDAQNSYDTAYMDHMKQMGWGSTTSGAGSSFIPKTMLGKTYGGGSTLGQDGVLRGPSRQPPQGLVAPPPAPMPQPPAPMPQPPSLSSPSQPPAPKGMHARPMPQQAGPSMTAPSLNSPIPNGVLQIDDKRRLAAADAAFDASANPQRTSQFTNQNTQNQLAQQTPGMGLMNPLSNVPPAPALQDYPEMPEMQAPDGKNLQPGQTYNAFTGSVWSPSKPTGHPNEPSQSVRTMLDNVDQQMAPEPEQPRYGYESPYERKQRKGLLKSQIETQKSQESAQAPGYSFGGAMRRSRDAVRNAPPPAPAPTSPDVMSKYEYNPNAPSAGSDLPPTPIPSGFLPPDMTAQMQPKPQQQPPGLLNQFPKSLQKPSAPAAPPGLPGEYNPDAPSRGSDLPPTPIPSGFGLGPGGSAMAPALQQPASLSSLMPPTPGMSPSKYHGGSQHELFNGPDAPNLSYPPAPIQRTGSRYTGTAGHFMEPGPVGASSFTNSQPDNWDMANEDVTQQANF